MTPTIRTPQLLGLAALAALGCASGSTGVEATPAAKAPKAPEEMTAQRAPAPSRDPVYFDTDQAVIRADARRPLKARAEAIRQHPEWGVVTIQGHCDERGRPRRARVAARDRDLRREPARGRRPR